MLIAVEINRPESPAGQHYLLRRHLRQVFNHAPFTGESWSSCVAAFLAVPGVPVLAVNATTQAPASFFRRLFEPRLGDDAIATQVWNALLGQLDLLGDTQVIQLVVSDETSSWVVFLSDDLQQALAYGGRALPGRRYSMAEDENDLGSGLIVREVLTTKTPLTVRRFNRDKLDVSVDLSDESGATITVRFDHALRARFPETKNERIRRLVEVSGSSGRTWFVFEPVDGNHGRVLAVQAASASWLPATQ